MGLHSTHEEISSHLIASTEKLRRKYGYLGDVVDHEHFEAHHAVTRNAEPSNDGSPPILLSIGIVSHVLDLHGGTTWPERPKSRTRGGGHGCT
jgi:hypothetical protein